MLNGIDFDYYLLVHSPGYVIDIYNDGKDYEYVIGNRCIKPNIEKAASDTLYDVASLTKTFTATIVFMAYEEHKIDIYDKVINIDSNFKGIKDIRIIDLLCHNQNIWTDGYLGDVKSIEEYYKLLYSAYIKDNNKTYVDIHYIILGHLLEVIYNKKYEEIVKEKIINKLNLKNTTFNPNPTITASNNFEYKKDGIVVDYIYPGLVHDTKARVLNNFGIKTAHASIFMTGKDLMRFLKAIINYELVSKDTLNLMLEYEEDNIYNNMGVRRRKLDDERNDIPVNASINCISFSGYCGPMFTIDFEKNIIIVIMCNIVHNSKLERLERKKLTYEIINKIYDNIIKE